MPKVTIEPVKSSPAQHYPLSLLRVVEPISEAMAHGTFKSKKTSQLELYTDDKVKIFAKYLTPPMDKFWYGKFQDPKTKVSNRFTIAYFIHLS